MFHLLFIFVAVLGINTSAFGQADYRNLDPGRPIAIEDAYPIEFRAVELQLGIPSVQPGRRGQGAFVRAGIKVGVCKGLAVRDQWREHHPIRPSRRHSIIIGTEPDRSFPPKLKSMELMEGQSLSGYWRKRYPKFNGAIWAYLLAATGGR